MESIDLTTLIVGAVIGVGVIELIMWIVAVIRNPGYDDLRPNLGHDATSTRLDESETFRTLAP